MKKCLAIAAVIWTAIMTSAASAQSTAPVDPQATGSMTSGLMFFTLISGLIVAIAAFAYFLRRRSNRDAARRAFDLDK